MPPFNLFIMDWNDLLGEFQGRSPSPKKRNNMNWLSSLFTGAGGILGTILQNTFNTRQIDATNKANRELVQMQNDAARAESELAYKRSLPQNQVANLMNAGMSRAGAINTLNGGGSYQPAPVSTAQDEAPQIDVTQAINAMQASAQLAEQKRQFNMQHQLAQRQQSFEEKKWSDESDYRSNLNKKLLADIGYTNLESDLLEIEKDIANANKEGRIETDKLEHVARQAQAILDKFKTDKVYNVMQTMSDEDLANLFKMQAWLNMVKHGVESNAPSLIMEGAEKLKNFLGRKLFVRGKK